MTTPPAAALILFLTFAAILGGGTAVRARTREFRSPYDRGNGSEHPAARLRKARPAVRQAARTTSTDPSGSRAGSHLSARASSAPQPPWSNSSRDRCRWHDRLQGDR